MVKARGLFDAWARQMSDPRRDGEIAAAWLLRRKVQLSCLLWIAAAAGVVAVGFGLGQDDGALRSFVVALLALALSMAIIRHRRANLLAEGEPDILLSDEGLVDNQSGAGLIPWCAIEAIRLDQRRNRGAGNALLLLRLKNPDDHLTGLRLGYRAASMGMWPRTGNHHWIDVSELDCQPAALLASIEARWQAGTAH